jgi:hypothetical protein
MPPDTCAVIPVILKDMLENKIIEQLQEKGGFYAFVQTFLASLIRYEQYKKKLRSLSTR